MKYELVMGLEVHVELATDTKLFCACSAKFGAEANENVCPACMGLPGFPAVTNKKAVDLAIAAALLTNSEISPVMSFDKKNYFYPDLPTGYQLTQMFAPICRKGWIQLENTKIGLSQIHIEADAGKLVHDSRIGASLVDYNRSTVPLIEIVSEPDLRTAEEVLEYLEKLRSLLSFAGVSDCKMQEGSMRCDVNISVRERGASTLGTRTEIKNMNSLKAIAAAIEYESARHIDALENGTETLVQETRRWDDNLGVTFSMREKETAADYRYFPNPEIMPIEIDSKWIEAIRQSLPETAQDKYTRMTEELKLSEYDSRIISGSKNLADIFDETLKHFNNPKEVVNWIIVELLSVSKGDNDITIDCQKFASLMKLVDDKTINRAVAKKLLVQVWKDGIDPARYVEENQLGMVSDSGLIEKTIEEVLSENGKSVKEFQDGNQKAYNFLVGQAMKKLAGKADPKMVNELIKKGLQI